MINCPKCHSEITVRAGYTSNRTPRYRCKACNHFFIERTENYGRKVDIRVDQQIIQLWGETKTPSKFDAQKKNTLSTRDIAAKLNISKSYVAKIVKKHTEETNMKLEVDLKLDEMDDVELINIALTALKVLSGRTKLPPIEIDTPDEPPQLPYQKLPKPKKVKVSKEKKEMTEQEKANLDKIILSNPDAQMKHLLSLVHKKGLFTNRKEIKSRRIQLGIIKDTKPYKTNPLALSPDAITEKNIR